MAQAILTQDVEQLGEKGDVVDVSAGYLRNFLVPRKLAQPATAGSIAEAQRRKDSAERAVREAAEKAQENAALLSKTVLTITHPAGDDGRLFGSVTPQEIVDAIRQAPVLPARPARGGLPRPSRARAAPGGTAASPRAASRSRRRDHTWSRSRCTM